MKTLKISILLSLAIALFFAVGCKKAEKTASSAENKGTATTAACAYPYDVEIAYEGPGGHSNGAYGRTNTLHAAGRAVEMITLAGSPEGSVINFNALYGGNSVNSIAYSATLVIESCNATEAGAAAVAKLVKDSVDAGINAENTFRKVKSGETNEDGVRVDIRADIKDLIKKI